MAINLQQFGLNWSLAPDSLIAIPPDFKMRLNSVKVAGANLEFRGVNPNKYTIGGYLGGGTYGSVYECKRESDGFDCVVKIAKGTSVYDLIKEVLIQIIIVEATKDKKHPEIGFYGPYAPFLYDVAYDFATETGYIVSQKMRATVSAMIRARTGMKDELIAASSLIFIQVGTMMSELFKMFGFNHRDFKTDNCMYIRDELNQVQVRLIDFGFSYIKFHKMIISGSDTSFHFGSLPKRDMTQFMFELYTYHTYLPAEVRKPLEDMLTFPLGTNICKMYSGCKGMQKWANTYYFLNDDKVANPNGDAVVVKRVFLKVREGKSYKTDLEWAPGMMGLFVAKPAIPVKTPPGKIFNPDTGRYVSVLGAVGKRLMAQINAAAPGDKAAVAAGLGVKLCPKDKPDRNPKTKRCVKACAAGQKRNATFKCKKEGNPLGVVNAMIAAAKAAPNVVKVCPDAKPNYNPKTKRCSKACPPGKKRNATFKCISGSRIK